MPDCVTSFLSYHTELISDTSPLTNLHIQLHPPYTTNTKQFQASECGGRGAVLVTNTLQTLAEFLMWFGSPCNFPCGRVYHVVYRLVEWPVWRDILLSEGAVDDLLPRIIPDKSTERVAATEGSDVTLECVADGFPVPQINWSKYGGQLPVGRYSIVLGLYTLYWVTRIKAAYPTGQNSSHQSVNHDFLEWPNDYKLK